MTAPTRIQKPNGRWYQIGDQVYPSVTTLLSALSKPALSNWIERTAIEATTKIAADVYSASLVQPLSHSAFITAVQARVRGKKDSEKQLNKAANIGTQTHSMIEWRLRQMLNQAVADPPQISQEAAIAYSAWLSWAEQHELNPIWIEETVWSHSNSYAGTMDLLAFVDGKTTLIDWKTGKSVYPEARLQNIAYQRALEEMGHGKPAQGLIVRLPKEPDDCVEVVPVIDSEAQFDVFKSVCKIWHWQQGTQGN